VHGVKLQCFLLNVPLCCNGYGKSFIGNCEQLSTWSLQLSLVKVYFKQTPCGKHKDYFQTGIIFLLLKNNAYYFKVADMCCIA